MERLKRTPKMMIVFSVCILVSVGLFLIVDTRYIGIGWVSDKGGLWYVSETYTPNNNVSYTVNFYKVNFTFMYWIDPWPLMDADLTAYFLIAFADNSSVVISINTGSYWFTAYPSTRPLVSKTTIDTSPIAGVLYHGYLDNPVGWKFIVSVF